MEDKEEIKLVFIGSYGVGKTNIIRILLGKNYDEGIKSNSSASFVSKSIEIEGHSYTVYLWDTIGRTYYMNLTKLFLKDAKGIFVVYDITDKNSFDEVDEWMKLVKETQIIDIPIMLIGNKGDEFLREKIKEEEDKLKAKEYGADYIRTSAKYNDTKNIQKALEILMKKIIKKELKENKKNKYDEKNNIKILKNELNYYKNECDKLRKDYDTLKKDYGKLNNDLYEAKITISYFEDNSKKNFNEINNLKNIIRQKDTEIFNLLLKIRNIEAFNKTSFNNNDIISVHFISPDQNINCPIKCLKNDTFAEVEERLYQKYQEYRETNNKFVLKEKMIMRFKKIIENNINDGDIVELIKLDQI